MQPSALSFRFSKLKLYLSILLSIFSCTSSSKSFRVRKDFLIKPALFIASSILSFASPVRFALAENNNENLSNIYSSPKYHFSIKVDSDFEKSPKLLQTHEFEIFFKSSKIKGFSVGVTVDPVRINNIREFATADGLAEKVLAVEKAKDGVFEVEKIAASEFLIPIITQEKNDKNDMNTEVLLPVYDIEYKVDSSRGENYYDIRTTIFDKKLYILTCQSKADMIVGIKDTTKNIIDSFSIIQ